MFAEVDQSSTSVSLDTRGRKVVQNHQKRRNNLEKERRNSEGKGGVEVEQRPRRIRGIETRRKMGRGRLKRMQKKRGRGYKEE